MNKIATILVPFDFSEPSKKALEYAVEFVDQDDNMKIMLAHISGDGNSNLLPENFRKIEEQYNPMLKNKLEWITQSGNLTQSLLEIQKTRRIDLVIMGTLGTNKKEITRLSNASKLVLAADCPVLVIPHGSNKFRIRKIALVLGQEEIEDSEVLSTLLNISRRFNAKVHVVTIQNRPESYGYSETDEKNENAIAYYLENFYSEHSFIDNPDVVEGILNYANEKEIDMIAILPRNHAVRSVPSEGKLTQMLTLRSKVPVLAID